MFDFIRPNIVDNRTIPPWYRYNTFLFAHQRAIDSIPETVRQTQIHQNEPVVDLAPLPWRLRNLIFRYLPQPLVQRIARAKHAAVRSGLRLN
jgi:hypothetical protein